MSLASASQSSYGHSAQQLAFVMSGRVMVDSHNTLPTASFAGQYAPDSSSRVGPRSAPGEAEVSEVGCTSKRVIKLSTHASCDNLIVPNSALLSMTHPSY